MANAAFTILLKAPFSVTCQGRGMQGAGGSRLEALDGLRGVAALAVVLSHVHLYALIGARPFATHAYLAVDLFFMISGFILAHAYGERLKGGHGLQIFLRARLARLYPLYALGAGLGFIALLIARPVDAQGIGGAGLILLPLLASLFLPWVSGGKGGVNAFPLNPPSWSLSLELWGNLAYGALAPRLGPRALACIIALSAAVLTGMALAGGGLNHGWRQADVWLGWPRFVFGFSVGLGLHRLWACGRLRLPRTPDWLLALALAVVLTLPAAGALNGLVDLLAALVLLPLLVALAVGAASSRRCAGPLAFGARLSYPLYAVHAAVVAGVRAAADGLGAPAAAGPLIAALALAASILAAWAVERWFDRPVRAWIAGRRPPIAAAAQPAG
jgi:peptidoglycan/LPS O-acetylase OafA/YrhL